MQITCPRCGGSAEARYYGPCATCVEALHERFAGATRTVAESAYEPKMNVTPNAVATKD